MKVIHVVGARPNFMKIAPLMKEFSKYKDIKQILVHTGQHYDINMSDNFFKELDIPEPDYNLRIGSGSHGEQTGKIMIEFEKVCIRENPNLVIVVGDVNSTIACALVAAKLNIKVAHVEAGLRSFDRTMPEEINRILTDQISDYLFVTEESGIKNLRNEGINDKKIFFVGNVIIDCLIHNLEKIKQSDILKKLGLKQKEYILLTMHRPSNVDQKETLEYMLDILEQIGNKIIEVYPIHPRTKANIEKFGLTQKLNKNKNMLIIDPLEYLDFMCLVLNAKGVLTDSGGVQEETTYLGIPCITMRKNTERPLTVDIGSNILVGSNKEKILIEINNLLEEKNKNCQIQPLSDGQASKRIVEILKNVTKSSS